MDNTARFFSKHDEGIILSAVRQAESRTSGEIRVRVEKSAGKDPLRAAPLQAAPLQAARAAFEALGMRKTALRNGVLFFLAADDRKFAVLGDDGINAKVPPDFWDSVRDRVQEYFRQNMFGLGLAEGIKLAGEQLAAYFPRNREDINELPDAISYGE